MTDIYLCRHGRTQLNVAGLLRGHLDPDLDLVGYAEARDLARQLRNVGLSRVMSSPLARAQETARLIAEVSQVELQTDKRLIDRDYDKFAGRAADDIKSEYGSVDSAPGVEPVEAVATRAQAVLSDLINAGDIGPVAVVSHDAVIRVLLDQLAPTPQHTAHISPRTGCWSLLRHDDSGWRLLIVDSKDDPVEVGFTFR